MIDRNKTVYNLCLNISTCITTLDNFNDNRLCFVMLETVFCVQYFNFACVNFRLLTVTFHKFFLKIFSATN